MTRAYDDEAMKPIGPRLEPPRSWWVKWVVLAVFTPTPAWPSCWRWRGCLQRTETCSVMSNDQ